MSRTSILMGVAAYAVLCVPSLLLAGKSSEFALMWISFMFCAVIVSFGFSAVAFSLAREDMSTGQKNSLRGRVQLAVLGFPAFSVGIAIIAAVVIIGVRLAS